MQVCVMEFVVETNSCKISRIRFKLHIGIPKFGCKKPLAKKQVNREESANLLMCVTVIHKVHLQCDNKFQHKNTRCIQRIGTICYPPNVLLSRLIDLYRRRHVILDLTRTTRNSRCMEMKYAYIV